jgi:hypothetical protein
VEQRVRDELAGITVFGLGPHPSGPPEHMLIGSGPPEPRILSDRGIALGRAAVAHWTAAYLVAVDGNDLVRRNVERRFRRLHKRLWRGLDRRFDAAFGAKDEKAMVAVLVEDVAASAVLIQELGDLLGAGDAVSSALGGCSPVVEGSVDELLDGVERALAAQERALLVLARRIDAAMRPWLPVSDGSATS